MSGLGKTVAMLKFVLKELSDDIVKYEYLANGKTNSSGEVVLDRSTGVITISKLADIDTSGWFAGHLFSKMVEFRDAGVFEDSGELIWY